MLVVFFFSRVDRLSNIIHINEYPFNGSSDIFPAIFSRLRSRDRIRQMKLCEMRIFIIRFGFLLRHLKATHFALDLCAEIIDKNCFQILRRVFRRRIYTIHFRKQLLSLERPSPTFHRIRVTFHVRIYTRHFFLRINNSNLHSSRYVMSRSHRFE